MIALLIATLAASTPVRNPGMLATAMHDSRKADWGPAMHYQRYARLFVTNGNRWGVDPVIVACIAYAESRYHVEAPKLYRKVCKTTYKGCDRPGPCRTKHTVKCRRQWVNNQEAGMMQVDNRQRFARVGYKLCTGKALTGGRRARMKKLRPPAVAICVGAYALSVFKAIAKRRRFKPKLPRNVRHFNNWPGLRWHFWTAMYNWGPSKRRRNGYPRVIAGCWRRYMKIIKRTMRGRP